MFRTQAQQGTLNLAHHIKPQLIAIVDIQLSPSVPQTPSQNCVLTARTSVHTEDKVHSMDLVDYGPQKDQTLNMHTPYDTQSSQNIDEKLRRTYGVVHSIIDDGSSHCTPRTNAKTSPPAYHLHPHISAFGFA